jgi:hypothetical protein
MSPEKFSKVREELADVWLADKLDIGLAIAPTAQREPWRRPVSAKSKWSRSHGMSKA